MGFSVAVKLAFVLTVGFAAMNRRNPSFSVVFACVVDGLGVTADVLTDCRISEPVVSFQKDTFASALVSPRSLSGVTKPSRTSLPVISVIE